jgi:SOS-response transcriptional repressor LexA
MGTFFQKAMSLVAEEKERRGSFRALCVPLELNPTTVQKWFTEKKGGEPRAPGIDQIGVIMDAMGAQIVLPDDKLAEYELIPKTSARAGAGSSHLIEDEQEGLYAFRKDFLGRLHISKNSVLLDVLGDSMEPTLRSGDTILVDRSDIEVHDGQIYLVGFQQQLLVKRLFRTVEGVALKSDNPAYMTTAIPQEYMDDFVVFGRMRWMARTF